MGPAETRQTMVDLTHLEAQLDTGHRISPGLARRLACEAGIIPAVLGGPSQVLDLGRKTRLHPEPQRIALAIQQGGCSAEGCDWPPGMCHGHHDIPFSNGSGTSLKNLASCSSTPHRSRCAYGIYSGFRLGPPARAGTIRSGMQGRFGATSRHARSSGAPVLSARGRGF